MRVPIPRFSSHKLIPPLLPKGGEGRGEEAVPAVSLPDNAALTNCARCADQLSTTDATDYHLLTTDYPLAAPLIS